jgi:hypothetical protein
MPLLPNEEFYSLSANDQSMAKLIRLSPPYHPTHPNQITVASPLHKSSSNPLSHFLAHGYTPRYCPPPPSPPQATCYFCNTHLSQLLFPSSQDAVAFPDPYVSPLHPFDVSLFPALVAAAQAIALPQHPFHYHARIAFLDSGIGLCIHCSHDVIHIQRSLSLLLRDRLTPSLPPPISLSRRLCRILPPPLHLLFPHHSLAAVGHLISPFLSSLPLPYRTPTPPTSLRFSRDPLYCPAPLYPNILLPFPQSHDFESTSFRFLTPPFPIAPRIRFPHLAPLPPHYENESDSASSDSSDVSFPPTLRPRYCSTFEPDGEGVLLLSAGSPCQDLSAV